MGLDVPPWAVFGHHGIEDPRAHRVEKLGPLPGRGFREEMSENFTGLDGHDARRSEVALLLEFPGRHANEKGCAGPLSDSVPFRVLIAALMLSRQEVFSFGEKIVAHDDSQTRPSKVS
jgi:hypothetical protein